MCVSRPRRIITHMDDSCPLTPRMTWPDDIEKLKELLDQEHYERRRADCKAEIQSHAVQLTFDLLMKEPDRDSFFRELMRALLEHAESRTYAAWLLDDDEKECKLWMTSHESGEWEALAPRAKETYEVASSFGTLCIVPLKLTDRTLGWIAMSIDDEPAYYAPWRRATLEAIAMQVTLALHQSRLAERSLDEARRKAVLEERNRIARDIHDTLAQGFAAILMQLQAVQRSSSSLPASVAQSVETAIDLARTHMIEARRSVGTLHPQDLEVGDVAAVLERTADLARRTTDVPIEVVIEELPPLGAGVEREIIGIAQEAITNAVRHARAHTIRVHAGSTRSVGFRLSVADDGRGIAKERFSAGFGLTSMQERAQRIGGSLTIVTAPRAGTEVVLAWEPPAFSIPTA